MRGTLTNTMFIVVASFLLFNSCNKDLADQNMRAPRADAGDDIYLNLPADSAVLDGRASLKTDHEIATYRWSKISGPVSYIIANEHTPLTSIKSLEGGVYQFELKVTDIKGSSSRDTTRVIVYSSFAEKSFAHAGEDITISLPTNQAVLQGSLYLHPSNSIDHLLWTKISGPTSYNILNPSAVQTWVSDLTEGQYQFELKLTDDTGQSDTDTVTVTVTSPYGNIVPNIHIYCKKIYTADAQVELNGSASIVDLSGYYSNLFIGKWTQVSGPNTATIADPVTGQYVSTTTITNLAQGKYIFRTEVTFNNVTVSDSVEVFVVQDTRSGKEYFFETTWKFYEDWDILIEARLEINPELFYDASDKNVEVHIKLHDRDEWVPATANYDDRSFYYFINDCFTSFFLYAHYPQDNELGDKKVTIRFRFK